MAKGEIVCFEQFPFLSECFQKSSAAEASENNNEDKYFDKIHIIPLLSFPFYDTYISGGKVLEISLSAQTDVYDNNITVFGTQSLSYIQPSPHTTNLHQTTLKTYMQIYGNFS